MPKKQFTENVKLGGLSIGDVTARLGCHIDRGGIDLEDADSILAGSRCTAKIQVKPDGDQQTMLIGGKSMKDVEPIEAVADIKRFGVDRDKFSFGMSFSIDEIDVSKLARFANRECKLTLRRTGDIPKPVVEPSDELGDADPGDAPTEMKDD